MIDKAQLRQTIISTGTIGAVLGVLPALAMLALRGHDLLPAPPRSIISQVFDLGLVFVASVCFCIFFFGLLPMVFQHGFVWLVRRWTGRA